MAGAVAESLHRPRRSHVARYSGCARGAAFGDADRRTLRLGYLRVQQTQAVRQHLAALVVKSMPAIAPHLTVASIAKTVLKKATQHDLVMVANTAVPVGGVALVSRSLLIAEFPGKTRSP